jgi:hypothetical protein
VKIRAGSFPIAALSDGEKRKHCQYPIHSMKILLMYGVANFHEKLCTSKIVN